MLDPASWVPFTRDLGEGGKAYFPHDCGGGRTLIVSNSERGFSAWCFRCSDAGFQPYPEPSLEQRLSRLKVTGAADDSAKSQVTLPAPLVPNPSEWPLYARVWLHSAGFSNEDIIRAGIGYHAGMDRVVLPVLIEDAPVYWQARGFDKGRPKYINPKVDKSTLVPVWGSGDPLVLTEDILSAIRVGSVTAAMPVMGTAISLAQANALRFMGVPVAIWMDPDDAGRKASRKIASLLRLTGVSVSVISTDKDPKCYSRKEIKNYLSGFNPTASAQDAGAV